MAQQKLVNPDKKRQIMKQVILLLLVCGPLFTLAQFYDDFSGNSFPDSPHWQGNVDAFGLTDDSLLQSRAILTTYLSTPNTLAYNVVWEFGIQLAFNPSRNNQLRIYLMADRDSLTEPLNGYFIQIGESGSADRYQLYKQEGPKTSLVMSSLPKHRIDPSHVNSKIKVSRDAKGNWKLYTAQNNMEFTLDAVGTDNNITSSKFFGIRCSFTNSNNDKFSFDYFKIDSLIETANPPAILSSKVIDSISLKITFNKKLDSLSASQVNHYTLKPDHHFPKTISYKDSSVILLFADSLTTNNYNLHVSGIADYDGNLMADTSIAFFYEAPKMQDPRDTIPPKLLSTLILDSASIQLSFNEPLDEILVTDMDHFILMPRHDSPRHIAVNDSMVVLSFTDSLRSGDYSLQIQRIIDLNGNRMPDTIINFHYEAPQPALPWHKLKPDSIGELLFIDTFQHDISSLWGGQTEKFIMEDNVVKQQNTITSPAFIHVANTGVKNRIWEAGIEINGKLTSQNYVRLYLSAMHDSLPENPQSYYLQIDGRNENHVYKLIRQKTASSRTVIFESAPILNRHDKLRTRVRISCDISGEWKIYTDEYDQNAFSLLLNTAGDSSVTDNAFSASRYTGWMTRFSKSRVKDYALHYFLVKKLTDITPITDSIPPKVLAVSVLDSVSIQLTFDEPLDSHSLKEIENFHLSEQYEAPRNVSLDHSIVILTFSDSLITNNYSLSIDSISDLMGNQMRDTIINFYYEAPQPVIPWQKLKPDSIGEVLFIDTFQHHISTLWSGETEKFIMEDNIVKQGDSISSPAFIHVANTGIKNRIWEAGIEVNGKLTSQNYVRLYMNSSNSDLPNSEEGYYLQIDGLNEQHRYKLYRQNKKSRKLLFESKPLQNMNNKLRTKVRISCDISGKWKIYTDEYDQNSFHLLLNTAGDSSVTDNTYSTSRYTGWMTRFSKTRAKDYALHYFMIKELINIPPILDSIPPKVLTATILDSVSVQLIFSEKIDTISATDTEHYRLDPGGNNPIASKVSDSMVVISFAQPFVPGDYVLTLGNILDQAGNEMVDYTPIKLTFEDQYEAKPFDIIINEIMVDPTPEQNLPPIEYTELRNLSDHDLQLKGWTYSSETKTHQFDSIRFPAHSYLLLYKEKDSLQVSGLDNAVGLSSWPSLVNNGITLTLKNEKGRIIDALTYELSWYSDNRKDDGGWSLERIDPYAHCSGAQNWTASIDPAGGTPGTINSVNQENTSVDLNLLEMEIIEAAQVHLIFNKQLDPYSAMNRNTFEINNGMGAPDSIHLTDHHQVVLFYPQDFLRGKHYQIKISNISDCAGQQISLTRELYYPDTISIHDIIINEILPDPRKGGVEFVEIYNNSGKTVDIAHLSLATLRTSDGKLTEKRITETPHLMQPTTYRLLSTNPDIVQSHYFSPDPDAFIKMPAFPILNNIEGTVVLLAGNTQIDRLDYREDMHDPLIIDSKGVSLERVNFNTGTNEEGNFKSAAATVGGATPGYANSQFEEREVSMKEFIHLNSKTFSPDNDGFEDQLEIHYEFAEGGKMANIEIYDDKGMLIRRLKRNHRLATTGTIFWNGEMENNSQAPVGIYLILIEIYDSTGMRKLIKKTCVLASKF